MNRALVHVLVVHGALDLASRHYQSRNLLSIMKFTINHKRFGRGEDRSLFLVLVAHGALRNSTMACSSG